MACQKVCKQGRDDIIVKVNIQNPTLHHFHTGLQQSKFQYTLVNLHALLYSHYILWLLHKVNGEPLLLTEVVQTW